MISVFISDLHIGGGASTDWFQRTVHKKCLKAVLAYIKDNASQIKDLVVLGDWFDQWIYPAYGSVPAIDDILVRNEDLFAGTTGQGDFVSCMDGIKGGFYYINGNHDMTVSCNDINRFMSKYSKTGRKVLGNPNPSANISFVSGIIHAEHGHLHTLLCRPDYSTKNRFKPLPFGYYVSRTVAHICKQKLDRQGAPNAAYLVSSGSPVFNSDNLIHSLDLIEEFLDKKLTPAQAILYALVKMTGMTDPAGYFYYVNGTTVNAAEVADMFSGLSILADWQSFAAEISNSLGSVAEKLCRTSSKIVLFGHTHVPGLRKMCLPESVYANTGFNCPDIPGMNSGKECMTFVELEEISGGYNVRLKEVKYHDASIITKMQCTYKA